MRLCQDLPKNELLQDDDTQEDGLSKAEVLRVLRGHMNDIKVHFFFQFLTPVFGEDCCAPAY